MSNDLITLASWMAGGFSNQKQSNANPQSYANIRIFFRPLPFDFFGGIGFYSEQVYDYDLWNPYRQGIHRLVAQEGQIYIENYGLKDGMLYAGAGRELDILLTITPDCIERRYNCSMVFKRDSAFNLWGTFFIFETVEYPTIESFGECIESLGGALICVNPINKVWIGHHRKVILYQAKASLHVPHHDLKQYWIKYGSLYTKFDERC
jgi:hypothetical protein